MKKIFFCFILFSLFLFSSFAEKISFSADSMSGQTGNSSSETKLVGNAYILTESMEISAELIELSGEDYKNIRAEGNVSGKNLETKMEFTCNELNYDRITKIARLLGNVNLVDSENDVKASAQIIEYNQDTDIAILQIQVSLLQKDNVCSGAYAVYFKNDKILDISGNAQVKQKSDTFRAQQISLNLDTQAITLAGNVRGSVVDSGSKKEEKPDDKLDEKPAEKTEDRAEENAEDGSEEKAEAKTEKNIEEKVESPAQEDFKSEEKQ